MAINPMPDATPRDSFRENVITRASVLPWVTVALFPTKISELGVDALVKAIKGEKAESLIDSGAALVTKENIAEFD